MIKTNLEKLVEMAVGGEICHPSAYGKDERVAFDGGTGVAVGTSGINFTVKMGDPAFDWASGDQLEPGVGIANPCEDANAGLALYACIGNDAVITEACFEGKDAKLKGTPGVVTGKIGGCEPRVLVHFPKRVVDRLCVGDRIQIRSGGVGLALLDYPDVRVMNCGPRLLKALNPSEKGGKVRIPVAKVIPGKLMGHGVGSASSWSGDVDIQSTSPEAMKEIALDQLRLGDLVAINEYDATHGPRYHKEATSIGVIVHGSSRVSGRGPGVNVIMTSSKGTIEAIITRKANVAELLGLQ